MHMLESPTMSWHTTKNDRQSSRWCYFMGASPGVLEGRPTPGVRRGYWSLWMLLVVRRTMSWMVRDGQFSSPKEASILAVRLWTHHTATSCGPYWPKNKAGETHYKGKAWRKSGHLLREHRRPDIRKSGPVLWPAFPRKVEHSGCLELITCKRSETSTMMVSGVKNVLSKSVYTK